jgi:arylsulfatase A-like enzyme
MRRGASGIKLLMLVGAAAASLHGCRTVVPPRSGRPNVILITIDTLRPDRLSAYGYTRQTPSIDSVAHDGQLFEHAVCDVPWTTASIASVFTGLYASRHGLRSPTERLSDSALTLAEVLHQQGFLTAAVVGSFPVASIYNLNQGFETYDEEFTAPLDPVAPGQAPVDFAGKPRRIRKVPARLTGSPEELQRYFAEKASNDACRPDAEVTDRAAAWLRSHADRDFFLWVHYFGPHERVSILQPWHEQWPRVIAEYDRDLAETDRQIGRLLAAIDQLNLRQRTLLILHADHGQSLGEDDYVGHGDNLYPASLRIPLLIRLPGRIPAGRRVPVLAKNVDIFPTVLSVLGITPPPELSGEDLSRSFDPAAPQMDGARVAYAETLAAASAAHTVDTPEYGPISAHLARFGLLRGERMYVRSEFIPPCQRVGGDRLPDADCEKLSKEELFDPFDRASSMHDLLAIDAGLVAWFREQLPRYRLGGRGDSEPVALSPADKEKLRALGYER